MNEYIFENNIGLTKRQQIELYSFLDICKKEFADNKFYDLDMICNICKHSYLGDKNFSIEYFVWSMKLNCKI